MPVNNYVRFAFVITIFVPSTSQAMTPQRAENALYEVWHSSTTEQRHDVERRLFAAVTRHAKAVVFIKLQEKAPDLVANIAGDALRQLARGQFRGACLFSTWVQAIALRKINEEIRRRTRQRRVIDDRTSVDDLEKWTTVDLEEGGEGVAYRSRQQIKLPNFDAKILLDQVLSHEDKELVGLKHEGLSSEEIAAKIGISKEAVNSRWRRLKQKKVTSR
jgi:RNA polymerase sigma factor (sigma-70 family)